jgi:hypothetical protein
MTQLEDQLRDILQRDAATLDVVEAGPEHAKRRARQRNRNRRAAIAGLGVAGIVGGTIAALQARPESHAEVTVNVDPKQTPISPKLSWRSVTGTVEFSYEHTTDLDGTMYALSTAPGQVTGGQPDDYSIYVTTDGEHYTEKKQSVGVSHLVADDGVLYALTSAPQDGGDATQLGMSTDGGAQWQRVSIPLQFGANMATQVRLAHRDHTTVVVASAADESSLATPNTIDSQFKAVARAAATETTTPATPRPHEQKVLIRKDGGDWETLDLDLGGPMIVQDLTATSNGYLLLTSPSNNQSSPGLDLFESPDGRAWHELQTPIPATAYGVKLSGDRVLAIDEALNAYVSVDGGHTFTTTNLKSMDPSIGDKQTFPVIDAGPLGVAVLVNTNKGTPPASLSSTLLFSADGSEWSAKTLSTPGVDKLWPWDVRVGTDHVEVSYNETGHPTGEVAPLRTFIGTPERS